MQDGTNYQRPPPPPPAPPPEKPPPEKPPPPEIPPPEYPPEELCGTEVIDAVAERMVRSIKCQNTILSKVVEPAYHVGGCITMPSKFFVHASETPST